MDVNQRRLILGVDPGTTVMGYALLSVKLNKAEVLQLDVIQMNKLPNPYSKLQKIFQSIIHIIENYHPDILSIEAPFYGKNPQSMLKLGRAQGVVIAACLHAGLEVFEYSPRKIKQSVTGKGNASKEQVAAMLERICVLPQNYTHFLDATDALAAAYCHYLQHNNPVISTKFSGWESFVKNNSNRIL